MRHVVGIKMELQPPVNQTQMNQLMQTIGRTVEAINVMANVDANGALILNEKGVMNNERIGLALEGAIANSEFASRKITYENIYNQ